MFEVILGNQTAVTPTMSYSDTIFCLTSKMFETTMVAARNV